MQSPKQIIPASLYGNGSFRSYSRSDPGSVLFPFGQVVSARFQGWVVSAQLRLVVSPTLFYLDFYVLKVTPASLG